MIDIDLGEIFCSFSKALDLSLYGISNHHKTVALISKAIADELNMPEEEQRLIFYSALVHDAGMAPEEELRDILPFEDINSFDHCQRGYEIFCHSKLTDKVAMIILHHHDRWKAVNASGLCESSIALASNIIYLADRVSVLTENSKGYILNLREDILNTISQKSGTVFNPAVVEAFQKTSKKESFWLDIQSEFLMEFVQSRRPRHYMRISVEELVDLVKCFSRIIDNKSHFTRNHSRRVALVVEFLAQKVGFSDSELSLIKIAGYLHDLGKISIPNSILDKPAKLTREEAAIVRRHTYYSYYLLKTITGFENVAAWGAHHHERLDGSGYPFHLTKDELPLGSRLMAVADIFTALTEDRPYRQGVNKQECLAILNKLVAAQAISEQGVNLVKEHYEELLALISDEGNSNSTR
ncbi:HD domain-containing protein [Desulfosporosinus sp. PR]|uniref:HD-GYP domain-containing protein n=1 Tax=Candidatus Desulfosporosinus nitrosoreducens TaxID=3401928 RepID=UPI0027FB4154|nr:HD domain-containing phosphohydrolase [Desulfosporosinus sp. PR]MDQ7092930.1 HD domain-containing protein [Desulfosporosinus sp. PR]